jgi:hypothetical protein
MSVIMITYEFSKSYMNQESKIFLTLFSTRVSIMYEQRVTKTGRIRSNVHHVLMQQKQNC